MDYRVLKKDEIFIQSGKKEAKYISFKSNNYQFVINRTGEMIIENIFDAQSDSQVIEKMVEKYPKTDREIIERDIRDILNIFIAYGVIEVFDKNARKNQRNIDVVGEAEYKIVEDFIKTNMGKNYLNLFTKGGNYDAIGIRSRVMNNQEYFYKYMDKQGNITAILGIGPNLETPNVIITTLIFKEDVLSDSAYNCFRDLIKFANETMINKVNKFRVVAMDDKTGRQESLFNLLEKSGFSKEAVLKDEMDGEDVIFFTYIEKFMGRKAV